MSDTSNPSSKTSRQPLLVTIKISVPQGLLDQALRLAEYEGWKPGEFYRALWERGLTSYAEASNTRLMNEKLRQEMPEFSIGEVAETEDDDE